MLTGIIRQVEKNGVIVIPKMFRQVLNIKENDKIIFEIDKEKNIIIIRPVEKEEMEL